MVTAVLCTTVFVLTLFMGEIVGLIIEARNTRRWRNASYSIGFGFDARRRRLPSVSRVVLPAVTVPREIPSALVYGESRQELNGNIEDFGVKITDFSAWDYFNRYPLVFRGVLCVVTRRGLSVPGRIMLVNWRTYLVDGLRVSDTFREFRFSCEEAFSEYYALFGRGGYAPCYVTPELRELCVQFRSEIHCLWIHGDEVIVLWKDSNPERFAELVKLSLGIACRLSDSLESRNDMPYAAV